ncbi:MAG: ABC transporter permease, partial [Actinomycetota bacterium]|nr:ABC transporter permease [Actinomycetota bacterium]
MRHPLVRYLTIRVGVSLLLVVGVTVVTFDLTNLVPASPITAALGERASSDPAIVEAFTQAQGLDKPRVVQYFIYLGHLLQGNLGTSIQTHNPVASDLSGAFPATAELALFVIVLSVVFGIGLGLVAALQHNRFSDQLIRVVSLVGISVPTFWLAVAAYFLFFFKLHWAPGYRSAGPVAQPATESHGDVHRRRPAGRPARRLRRRAAPPHAARARPHTVHRRPAR